MKKLWIVLLLAFFLISCGEDISVDNTEDFVPVKIANARLDTVSESYVTIGEIVPKYSYDLRLPSGSRIGEILVDSGSQVEENQVLMTYILSGRQEELLSPIEGKVSKINVSPGQVSSDVVIRLIEAEDALVKTMLSSELQKKIELGEKVQVLLGDGRTISGVIEAISQEADPFSRLYETYITIDTGGLAFGEFVELNFITDQREAVLVSANAIVRKNDEKYIFQYRDGEVQKLIVETGLSIGSWVEIINVDANNFEFVILGQNFLKEGSRIVVID
jgi:multidrug efflux pump subunit AcrA (membrane-fusion protein)